MHIDSACSLNRPLSKLTILKRSIYFYSNFFILNLFLELMALTLRLKYIELSVFWFKVLSLLISLAIVVFTIIYIITLDFLRTKSDIISLEQYVPPPIEIKEAKPKSSQISVTALKNIAGSKIFGEVADPNQTAVIPEQIPEKIVKSKGTQFSLIGTFINSIPENSFAIIENGTSREQDGFGVGENIFDEAILKSIRPNKIIINRDGRDEVLTLEAGVGQDDSDGGSPAGSEIVEVPENEVNEALSNLPVLLTQARTVPYFSNGKRDGLRMFAISFFDKIGMKNGDILKSINGNDLNDPANALQLFEKLKQEKSLTVKLVRNQVEKVVVYQVR
jgi:general secretion pathway protein C